MAERLVVEVDVAAIRHNVARMAALAGRAPVAAEVGADGWGHGAVRVARAALEGGATLLAVDTVAEAEELRRGGITAPVLIGGPLWGDEWSRAAALGARVTLWGAEGVAAAAAAPGPPLEAHLLVDTGLGPPGARTEDVAALATAAAGAVAEGRLAVAALMSEPAASAQTAGEHAPFLREQFLRLRAAARAVAAHLPDVAVHAADAAALLRDPTTAGDMVRVGEALYGICPFGGAAADHGLRPAMVARAAVGAVSVVRSRESVGRGRAWRAARGAVIAVVAAGPADGYPPTAIGRAEAVVAGRRRPVVGVVGPRAIAIDLGPEGEAQPGEAALLIGGEDDARVEATELAEGGAPDVCRLLCALGGAGRREYR